MADFELSSASVVSLGEIETSQGPERNELTTHEMSACLPSSLHLSWQPGSSLAAMTASTLHLSSSL